MRIINLIENTEGSTGCVCAHGLSFYVETGKHKLLVDLGPSEETLRNAEKLGEVVDIGKELKKYPTMFYTCHCTGEAAYKMMKLSMGERLQYVHSGDEVTIKKRVANNERFEEEIVGESEVCGCSEK